MRFALALCRLVTGALFLYAAYTKIPDMATDMILSHDERADKKSIYDRLRERFSRIGLDAETVLNSYPVQLPAGTKQRCVIGISTLLNPKVVVADEPTSALDVSVQARVLALFQDLQEQHGFACLFISHDLAVVDLLADRIAVLYHGRLVEEGTGAEVLGAPKDPYTQRLLASLPVPDPAAQAERREELRRIREAAG